MSRAYNVIDADGHILEPLDLRKNFTSQFRDGGKGKTELAFTELN